MKEPFPFLQIAGFALIMNGVRLHPENGLLWWMGGALCAIVFRNLWDFVADRRNA